MQRRCTEKLDDRPYSFLLYSPVNWQFGKLIPPLTFCEASKKRVILQKYSITQLTKRHTIFSCHTKYNFGKINLSNFFLPILILLHCLIAFRLKFFQESHVDFLVSGLWTVKKYDNLRQKSPSVEDESVRPLHREQKCLSVEDKNVLEGLHLVFRCSIIISDLCVVSESGLWTNTLQSSATVLIGRDSP